MTDELNVYGKRRASSPPCLPQNNNHTRMSHPRIFRTRNSEPAIHDIGGVDDTPLNTTSSESSSVSLDGQDDANAEHVIHLSSIEHCMPRAYIRVCLAYRLPEDQDLDSVIARFNNFIRNTVNAKPYLAGCVRPANPKRSAGPVEIAFTNEDFVNYPEVEVRHLYDDDNQLMDFGELDAEGFPPSKLHPDKVAVLPAVRADEMRAPVFRAQANIVRQGLIISFYLHHCISDGTGLGLLVTGAVQEDDFAFKRHLEDHVDNMPRIGKRLATFANRKSVERTILSWSDHNQIPDRVLQYKTLGETNGVAAVNPPGRGCVITIRDSEITGLREELTAHLPITKLSRHDVLQAFIWRHMTKARLPVVKQTPTITTTKLLIPVNIRNKLIPALTDCYFGAAVDFAVAEFDLMELAHGNMAVFASAANTIRNAVDSVDEPYIRQSIALARTNDIDIDVRDLLASNMNRVTGADMYITSWEKMGLYDAELELGIGKPRWVRKPWSRDPGSCIILPRNPEKTQFEIVIQMAEADMERLLEDPEFMKRVSRVID